MPNKSIKPDLQLLVHKFSDYYPQFMMYDAREFDYPVYRTKVTYTVAKEQKLHPVILSVLKMIK